MPEEFLHPWLDVSERCVAPRSALVIGAGLAGTSVAWSLARRGLQVLILEREATASTGASGNSLGLFLPYLSVVTSPLQEFYGKAFASSASHLEELQRASSLHFLKRRGAVQLLSTERLRMLAREYVEGRESVQTSLPWAFATQAELSERVGVEVSGSGFWMPDACTISPPELCKAYVEAFQSHIQLRTGADVVDIVHDENGWHALNAHKALLGSGDVLVVASAFECARFPFLSFLPVEPVRGEIVYLESKQVSAQLRTALCFSGYLLPSEDGPHVLGASYRHKMTSRTLDEAEQRRMIKQLHQASASSPTWDINAVGGRVAFRTSTHDRLPYVGPVPHWNASRARVHKMRSGTQRANLGPIPYLPGCYVSVGHGSRGLVSTHFSAECIADHVVRNVAVDPLIHPGRVAIRLLKNEIGQARLQG